LDVKKVKMYIVKKNLFSNTIFDNDKAVEQKYPFQYSNILIPLNTNLQLTVMIWEKIYSMENEDKRSLRNSDME